MHLFHHPVSLQYQYDVKRLSLDEALSHIRQTCEQRVRPFCFIVGAGISNPPVKLAGQMIDDFKKEARKRGRYLDPVENQSIDIYSHWFSRAYLDPSERQNYLRKQIVSKQLSHASFRLAHILLNQTTIASVVIPKDPNGSCSYPGKLGVHKFPEGQTGQGSQATKRGP
jgi:hypothetical protein